MTWRPLLAAAAAVVWVSAPGRLQAADAVRLPIVVQHDLHVLPFSVDNAPRSRIRGIVQDGYGFLWLGTTSGLYRYDGYRLEHYRHDPADAASLSADGILTLYKDRGGLLWIGTGVGLDRLDPASGRFTHYRHDNTDARSLSGAGYAVHQSEDGTLWVGTSGGLDRMDPETGGFTHYRHDPRDEATLTDNVVLSLHEDRRGHLWIGTNNGLNVLDTATGGIQRFRHDPANPRSLGNDHVSAIGEDGSGALWLGSVFGGELTALDVKTGQFTRYSFHAEEMSAEGVTGINALYTDRDGGLWVGTMDKGLLKLDREARRFTQYRRDPAETVTLPSDTVLSVFEDAEGVMWVGTQSGVAPVLRQPPPFVNYTHRAARANSLADDMIWSVLGDRKGALWIGTESGLDRLDRRTQQFTVFKHDPSDPHSLAYDKVAGMAEDRSGALWIGTYGGGLDRFDPATGRFVHHRRDPNDPHSLDTDLVLSLFFDRRGGMWVGTQDGALNRRDGAGRFKAYRSEVHARNFFHSIYEDRAGLLWLGGYGGLGRFNPLTEQLTYLAHDPRDPHSLSSDTVWAVHEDRQGRLWVGTEAGLDELDRARGSFTRIARKDGLAGNSVRAIREDAEGSLWLATEGGLSRFHPATRTFRNFTESDGLPGNFLNPYGLQGMWQSPKGEMVIGSTSGLTTFFPDRLSLDSYVPPVVLTGLELFTKPVSPGQGSPLERPIWATDTLTLTHAQSIFTLAFAGLSYSAPDKNRYRYRLEGLEREWNVVDSRRRQATYTSLSPGRYTFRAQASTDGEAWSEPGIALALTVRPPWWATWWFRGLVGLAGLGLVLAAHHARTRTLRQDAAHREQLLRVVEQNERRFRGLIENSSEHIVLLDRAAVRTYASPTTVRVTGYEPEELVGQSGFSLLHPEDLRLAEDTFAAVLALPGSSRAMAMRVRHKDGHWIWSESVLTNLLEDPAVAAVVVNSRDVTERREAERERRARETATAANRAKSTFLAAMSHEIRTPMNAIIDMTARALDAGLAPGPQQYVSVAHASARNLLGIVDDILDFSKIEAEKLFLEEAPFSLRDVLDEVTEAFRATVLQKHVELITSVAPATPDRLVGDARRLRQVVTNLVANAFQFTYQGEVVVRAESVPETAAGGAPAPPGRVALRVSVRDTGIGIPVEQQRDLFQAFTQDDSATSRKYGGTGLGLVISRRLAQLMGGDLALESTPGVGTTFSFTAPFATEEPCDPPVRRFPPCLLDRRVLIVEDTATSRELLKTMVDSWAAVPAVGVATAEDGLALLAAHNAGAAGDPFGLVILDWRLPGISGLEAVARIRGRQGTRSLPIVMVSAYAGKEEESRSAELGVNVFLAKPITAPSLFAAILEADGPR